MDEVNIEELLKDLNTELEDIRIKSELVSRKQTEVNELKSLLKSQYAHVGKSLKGLETKNPIISFFTF